MQPVEGAKGSEVGGQAPLWQLLLHTAQGLQAVRAGQSATQVLDALQASSQAALRPAVQALLFQVLRQWGRAQALRQQLATRKPSAPVDALLCTALALAWQPEQAPYTPFTLVNQAVEAAKRSQAMRSQAGFVNACLRRFLRERDALVQATDADPVARWNHPEWWIAQLRRDHPGHWQAILEANNQAAPMVLRVSQSKTTQTEYQQALKAINIEACLVGESGLMLAQPLPVGQLPGFEQGWVSVQDGAAQLAAPLLLQGLDTQAPLRLLDACAAPGGKTAHLLDWAQRHHAPWQVLALEVDAQRAQRIEHNLHRLSAAPAAQAQVPPQVQVVVADAAAVSTWWPAQGEGALFDAILLDAPCTASGIVRRHPDVRWLRRASDIAQLADQQQRLLQALWPLLKPGGRLLYCTCSVFVQEGQAQIQAFVARHSDARWEPSPGHLLPGLTAPGAAVPDNQPGDRLAPAPHSQPRTASDAAAYDGFFYALLHKAPN